MTEIDKIKRLRKFKMLATGLFLLMAIIFIICSILSKSNDSHWIGYVKAFSEAAMVGALADWFAVTALFNYPLGLKIPHTNLIANSKERIGENLGNFVVDNFLAPESIRPYIKNIKVAAFLSAWMQKNKNQKVIIENAQDIIRSAVNQIDDEAASIFISGKIEELSEHIKIETIISDGIYHLIGKKEHERIILFLSTKFKNYLLENKSMIYQKVEENSATWIPKFIDRKIAEKLLKGMQNYLAEVETNKEHPLRLKLEKEIIQFAEDLKHTDKYQNKIKEIKDTFLNEEKTKDYSFDLWMHIKNTILKEITSEEVNKYLQNAIKNYGIELQNNIELQQKIDSWIQLQAYKLTLKNSNKVAEIISNTVGNWEEKQLSRTLELEVGKDLQFIRVNGTIVGGIVGLLIYTITHFLL